MLSNLREIIASSHHYLGIGWVEWSHCIDVEIEAQEHEIGTSPTMCQALVRVWRGQERVASGGSSLAVWVGGPRGQRSYGP